MALIQPQVLDSSTREHLLDEGAGCAQSTIMQHPYEQVVLSFSAPEMPPLSLPANAEGQPRIVIVGTTPAHS